MKLLRHQDIGLMIIAELAVAGESGVVALSTIAGRHGISVFYLKKIARALKSGGLIVSREGFGGGYRLARPKEAISVWDVIRAVDSGVTLAEYENQSRDACPLNKKCLPRSIRSQVAGALQKSLSGLSVSNLLSQS